MTDIVHNGEARDTYFAPAERLEGEDLRREIEIISQNAFIDEMLHTVSGLLAVLNDHRQIVALNDTMMKMLGVANIGDVLGIRPGEALGCVHSTEMPGGCGTSSSCPSCGIVISIVLSLSSGRIEERTCAVTIGTKEQMRDMFFNVRCAPVDYRGKRFLLVFLQDITYQKRLTQLERVFFHDISNIITGLLSTSELISDNLNGIGGKTRNLIETSKKLSARLASEIEMQRSLVRSGAYTYAPVYGRVSVEQIFDEIRSMFQNIPVSKNKRLIFPKGAPDFFMNTDISLVLRVLNNMLTNAFEETPEGEEVKMWTEISDHDIRFCVWNRKAIPPEISKRIFERNFSTKADMGRGNGTFSMKFFGEEVLGGKVSFTTSKAEGTTFRLDLNI